MVKSSKSDQLYLQLRRRISAMKDGEPFPTVRQLMTEYQVSQSTVTPAINQLKEKGLIEAYVGRGSFVSKKDAGKPHMLLLQHNWPTPMLPLMAERGFARPRKRTDSDSSTGFTIIMTISR